MIVEVVLLLLTAVAAATDLWRHKIYNWTTYPGILAGVAINAGQGGTDGLMESLAGFGLCGFIMLVCFVLFQLGGGDVKLMAMAGACLGVHRGLEVLLWTFTVGAVAAIVLLIWRIGFIKLTGAVLRHLAYSLRLGTWLPLSEAERKQLQPPLYLGPAALLATAIVVFRWFV